MQPYIFPYIGYFHLINAVDKFIIYDDVSFIKQGWINRNYIKANDSALIFSIPIKDASSYKNINETYIKFPAFFSWKSKFLKTIEQNYRKAPFFKEVYNLINTTLSSEVSTISELATLSIQETCEYLSMKTEIVETSSIYNNSSLKGENRVIDICRQEKSSHYINPIGGESLYSAKKFNKFSIQLKFIESFKIQYEQDVKKFIPSLSIIDLLMHCSKKEIQKILNMYRIVD